MYTKIQENVFHFNIAVCVNSSLQVQSFFFFWVTYIYWIPIIIIIYLNNIKFFYERQKLFVIPVWNEFHRAKLHNTFISFVLIKSYRRAYNNKIIFVSMTRILTRKAILFIVHTHAYRTCDVSFAYFTIVNFECEYFITRAVRL